MPFLIALSLLLATPTPPPASCTAPEHRQFDFWIGEWEVRNPAGKVVGTSRITSIAGGCGLLEEWTGAAGTGGKSINAYDPAKKQWHQTWVGSDGTVLYLDGTFSDGQMRLADANSRITWTANADGTVRQFWETKGKDGTYKPAFDGTYSRKKSE